MLKFVAPTSSIKVAPASFEELASTLRNGSALERRDAARNLRECGEAAIPLLCDALGDPCIPVRLAAAESLGEIGDPAAIPALTRSLRACFHGGSARRQLATGCLGSILAVIAGLLFCLLNPLELVFGLLRLGFDGLWNRGKEHAGAEPQRCRAPHYARALVMIAERNPSPEFRELLPELRAASIDILQVDREARKASREVAQRIERLTELLNTLPLPASAPSRDDPALPLPAGPGSPAGSLPRACE